MISLGTVGGGKLAAGAKVAAKISALPAGYKSLPGNIIGYAAGVYQAFTSMWGVYVANNDRMSFTADLGVKPDTFPAGTIFMWNVTPDDRYAGVNGYLHLSYGNYDNDPGVITSRQAKNITTLSLDVDWSFAGSTDAGVLSECYLTTTSHPSGDPADKVFEVGFFSRCSQEVQDYANSLPAVGTGSFVSGGVTWNVVQGASSNGGFPYFIATRVGYVDHHGVLPFKDYLTFLTTSGKITGNEWFNGFAFGAEPSSGASTLTINNFAATYS